MSTTNLPDGISEASADAQLTTGVNAMLASADATSASSIQLLSRVHQARASRLTRIANASTPQYGVTSTQAVAAKQALAASQATFARLNMTQAQAATAAPKVAASGWAFHGRVFDAQLQPVSGHTVFLVDSKKNYLNAYGFAYTNKTGYFLINYPGAAQQSPAVPAAPAPAATDQLFIEVVNTSAKPVYLSSTAFEPTAGDAIYQNISLASGEPALGDPPAEIGKVAIPATTKQT